VARGPRATSIATGSLAGAATDASAPSAAMASRSLRRWPTKVTPRSFRSSAVRLGSTLSSISLSRNAGALRSRPKSCSHSAMSMVILGSGERQSLMNDDTPVPFELPAIALRNRRSVGRRHLQAVKRLLSKHGHRSLSKWKRPASTRCSHSRSVETIDRPRPQPTAHEVAPAVVSDLCGFSVGVAWGPRRKRALGRQLK